MEWNKTSEKIELLQIESWKLLPDASGYTKIVEMILRVLLHIFGYYL